MILALPPRVRSLLFAPAVRPDLVAKLPSTGADAVVIDCEDATPVAAKARARIDAAAMAAEIGAVVPTLIRVNAVDTPWFLDDIAALPSRIAGVVLPKVETMAGVDAAARALEEQGMAHTPVIAGIETALGVADARSLLANPMFAAAYFGAEDFIADMGGTRTSSNSEVGFARASVAISGRVGGIPVIDQIVADFRDDVRCRRECQEARAMGYVGKLCIHPAQVAIANSSFSPSVEEIEQARRILTAYERAAAEGIAAIDFEGRMVDEPVAAQARRILDSIAD